MLDNHLYVLETHSHDYVTRRLKEAARDRLAAGLPWAQPTTFPVSTIKAGHNTAYMIVGVVAIIALCLLALSVAPSPVAAQSLPPGGITPNPFPIPTMVVPPQLLGNPGFENTTWITNPADP